MKLCSNAIPRLSERLYFLDSVPKVLMLQLEIYGAHACWPCAMSDSKTS